MPFILRIALFPLVFLALAIALLVCAPPPLTSAAVSRQSAAMVQTPAFGSADTSASLSAANLQTEISPLSLDVPQWPGHQFIFLRKNPMFEKFGYEIYDSRRLGAETSPAREKIALKNHRLRAEIFAGRTLTALWVQPQPGGEFLIAFVLDTIGDTVWGMTKDRAIEGIALFDDLAAARARWKGATVYSRRRLIDTWDSLKSSFVSTKVSISEPLMVLDAVWGRTPLPPKPVWLLIERSGGGRGFIPVHVSWTNVLASRRKDGLAWADDIIAENPKVKWRWDDAIWEAIDRHTLIAGMTREQVRLSWGEPTDWRDSLIAGGDSVTVWVYEAGTAVFCGDSLVSADK